MIKTCVPMLAILLFFGPWSSAQDTKLDTLLRTAPRSANSVAYINIPALRALLAEGTFKNILSTSVNEVRVVSEIELKTFEPKWELGEATLTKTPGVDDLARVVGGYVDTVSNIKAVWSPNQSYLIPGLNNELRFIRPADRKLLSSWISNSGSTQSASYLLQQTKQPEQFLSFMLAIDLENYLSPVPLAKRISTLEAFKGVDVTSIANTFVSAKGLTIIVGRKSLSECMFTIEFASPPNLLLPFAGKTLSEVLERNGAAAPEVAGWSVKVQGNSLVYQGAISEASLDGLLGIFSIQDQADELEQKLKGSSANDADPIFTASKAYFDKVATNIARVRNHQVKNNGERAKWNEATARRIEGMGTLNVDPDVVDYGTQVATLLRGDALLMQQSRISAGAQKAQNTVGFTDYGGGYGGGYYGGGYGYNSYYDTRAQDRSVDAQARAQGSSDFRATVASMDQKTADVRRAMTTKFNKQF